VGSVPMEIKFVGTWICMSGNVTVAAPAREVA
jgi:hypothetical protein